MPSRSAERRIREGLADLAFGSPARAAAAVADFADGDLWQRAIPLSGVWRITPALCARGALLPDGVRAALRRVQAIGAAQAALTLRRSAEVFALLERHGVESVAFKGIALLGALYRDPALRMVTDLDLMVREADFPVVARLLEDAGYASIDPPFERHVADIRTSVRLHNYARTFVRDGFEVDVHWQLGGTPPPGLDAETLLRGARDAHLGAAAMRVPAPVDAILLTVHHAMRSAFTPRSTLKDALDLAAWWTRGRADWECDALIAAAQRAGLAPSLLALWETVAARDPQHPLRAGVDALRSASGPTVRTDARGLAEFFAVQLAHGDVALRTVEVFSLPLFARWWAERWRRRRTNAFADDPMTDALPKRPFAARVAGFAHRTRRVVRELADVRRLGAYRAMARAQRRCR